MSSTYSTNIVSEILSDKKDLFIWNLVVCLVGVAVITLCAQITIMLPFSPVPITGQSFAILVIGSSYGFKRALVTSLSYVGLGALGLPVFSGGKFGLLALSGPTGGYILGFIIAASVMGLLGDMGKDRNLKSSLGLFALGHIVIFIFGILWLSNFVPSSVLLAKGFFPFIPGLILKTILAGFFSKAVSQILKSHEDRG